MAWNNSNLRYGSVAIILHWLMLVLILAVYACIELHEFYPRGSATREALKQWHYMFGLTVFFLVWFRIVIHLMQARPVITPSPPRWQLVMARGIHVLLYLLMVGMPIGGWLILSFEGETIPFWGLELPPLSGNNRDMAHTIEEIHGTIGKIGYFLIGLHAFGALVHHYFTKDNTLTRMLPARNRNH